MGPDDSNDALLSSRVQYLDDTDIFSSSNFPEPTRPPTYTIPRYSPLSECLAGIHRLLMAPHRLADCTLQLSHTKAYLGKSHSLLRGYIVMTLLRQN